MLIDIEINFTTQVFYKVTAFLIMQPSKTFIHLDTICILRKLVGSFLTKVCQAKFPLNVN